MNESLLFTKFFLSAVEGSGEPELCPAGTFSPVSGLTREGGCLPCPAGFYCRAAGLRAPTGPCSQGQCIHFNVIDCTEKKDGCPFRRHSILSLLWQATGAPLVRLLLQLFRALQAITAHRVVQLQSCALLDSIRTEKIRQAAPSARQVGSLLSPSSSYHFKQNTHIFTLTSWHLVFFPHQTWNIVWQPLI